MSAQTLSASPTTTGVRRSRIARKLAFAAAAALLAVSAAIMPASAASVPAHAGKFSCGYDAAGHRLVTAALPTARSFTGGEQVWWFARVYRKTSTGWVNMGRTRADNMTGWANQYGMVTGAFVPGAKWINDRTKFIPINGGTLRMPSKGTYRVAGYFWWHSFSTSWTSSWATNLNGSSPQTCTFRH